MLWRIFSKWNGLHVKELLLPSRCQEVAETLLPTGFRQNSAEWPSLCSALWCYFSWTSLLSSTSPASARELKKDFAVPIVCLPPNYWVSFARFALSRDPGPHSWQLTDWHMAVRWGGKHYCTKLVTALSWQEWRPCSEDLCYREAAIPQGVSHFSHLWMALCFFPWPRNCK